MDRTDAQQLITAMVLCLSSLACPAKAQWRANVNIASDYVFRGILQTRSGLAASAAVEYQGETGWFVGAWLGRLDISETDDRDFELDLYAGYAFRVNRQISIDAVLTRYSFPQNDLALRYDWTQLSLGVQLGEAWSLRIEVEDNWFASEKLTYAVDINYEREFIEHWFVDIGAAYHWASAALATDYTRYHFGVARNFGALQARIALSDSDSRLHDRFGARADTEWVISLSWDL